MYEEFLPKEYKNGKIGYYPVMNAEEWEELPAVYKAMEWFPVEVYNRVYKHKERTVAEYIEFHVIYMTPYKIGATVKVHVQAIQKILFCNFGSADCHLYSVCGVVFDNGERWDAKWYQDQRTGAFAIYAGGKCIGRQGGYSGFIPNEIEKTEDGFKRTGYKDGANRCYYQLTNPFK